MIKAEIYTVLPAAADLPDQVIVYRPTGQAGQLLISLKNSTGVYSWITLADGVHP